MIKTTLIRTLIALAVCIVIAAAVLAIRAATGSSTQASREARSATTSKVWTTGDTWRVTVVQDSGAVSPTGKGNVSKLIYDFKVTHAPTSSTNGLWEVTAKQRGAEGPFAAGWRLLYAADGPNKMHLKMVASGPQKAVEAELSSIVLGLNFPLTTTYSAPPKDATLTSAQIAKMTTAPSAPTSAPPTLDSETSGTGKAPDGMLPKEGDPNVIPAPGTGAPMPGAGTTAPGAPN